MDLHDEQLIAEYLAGNSIAFDTLVRKYTPTVYSFIRHIIRDEHEAEDVVQESFVKAWKNMHRYQRGKNFKTWLLTIARNTAYDYLRKKKSRAFSEFEDENGENTLLAVLAADIPTAMEESILEQDVQAVRAALEELKPLYREVLELRYGENLTFEEIAEIMGKPMNTVKSQARRALLELKKLFAPNTR